MKEMGTKIFLLFIKRYVIIFDKSTIKKGFLMGKNDILEQALHLKANERFLLVEELLKSLDTPDENINKIWEEEANKRVDAFKKGELETVSEKDFFNYEY